MRNRLFFIAVGAILAACDEIPQDTRKPFAGPDETRSYEKALRERAAHQDDYRVPAK